MFKRIDLKIGNMRKSQNFSVYGNGKEIIVQSLKSIGRLNTETNKFYWTNKGCYFPHLVFAKEVNITEEIKQQIINLVS